MGINHTDHTDHTDNLSEVRSPSRTHVSRPKKTPTSAIFQQKRPLSIIESVHQHKCHHAAVARNLLWLLTRRESYLVSPKNTTKHIKSRRQIPWPTGHKTKSSSKPEWNKCNDIGGGLLHAIQQKIQCENMGDNG